MAANAVAASPLACAELGADDPRWLAFSRSHPDAGPFHHPAWSTLLEETYGYRRFAVVLEDEAGAIRAGMPLMEVSPPLVSPRWFGLPFTDACGPLADSAGDERMLLEAVAAAAAAAGIRRVEVRAPVAAPGTSLATVGTVHELELGPDPDAIFRTFAKSQVQRNVRRAEREGVEVVAARTAAEIDETFYKLHVRTRRRLGVPVQPRGFFRRIARLVLDDGLGFVLLARSGGETVAGAVFLEWNGHVTYKFGASEAKAWTLRPNHAIFWEAIRRSCESGARTFDFGRTESGNEGLRSFKAGWGTVETKLVYTRIGEADGADVAQGFAGRAMAGVIRHSPSWVCRGLGEALYRYAA
ncbi:MAG TPA: GNAT family N-acetyltransferase [Gaiellaceae bacterium]